MIRNRLFLFTLIFCVFLFLQIWEKLQVDLKVNGDGEAVWKGNHLLTLNGEKIKSETLINSTVK